MAPEDSTTTLKYTDLTPWRNVNLSYDQAWVHVINTLANTGWVSQSASKEGGVISTDWKSVRRGKVTAWLFEQDSVEYERGTWGLYEIANGAVYDGREARYLKRISQVNYVFGPDASGWSLNSHDRGVHEQFIGNQLDRENVRSRSEGHPGRTPTQDATYTFDAAGKDASGTQGRLMIRLRKGKNNNTTDIRIMGYVNALYGYNCAGAIYDVVIGEKPYSIRSRPKMFTMSENCTYYDRTVFRVADNSEFVSKIIEDIIKP
jgi:hypothetical protein